jgi:DNA-binding response OmpR family regulator
LIVENDRPLRQLLAHLLRSRGFATRLASTVAAGLEELRMQEPPHCLLLDLGLPDGAGTKLLQHLRAKDMTTKVAVITGAADQKTLNEAMKLQPDFVLKKPLGLREVEAWLSAAIPMPQNPRLRQVVVA